MFICQRLRHSSHSAQSRQRTTRFNAALMLLQRCIQQLAERNESRSHRRQLHVFAAYWSADLHGMLATCSLSATRPSRLRNLRALHSSLHSSHSPLAALSHCPIRCPPAPLQLNKKHVDVEWCSCETRNAYKARHLHEMPFYYLTNFGFRSLRLVATAGAVPGCK